MRQPRLERITVVELKNGKLVKYEAWQTKHHEDPERKAIRLLAMKKRLGL